MRIALAHSHLDTFGGGERAVLALAEGLAPRHDVRLVVGRFRRGATFPGLQRVPADRLQRHEWLYRRVQADAVVANSFGANLLSLRNGAHTVYWVHSLRSAYLKPGSVALGLVARRALDCLAVRRAARVVANSGFTATRLAALYGRSADAVIYPGVDLACFKVDSTVERQDFAVTVGRISPEKGLERLFDSWRDVEEVPLVVVGSGESAYVERLKAIAPDNVRFVGPASQAAVAHFYRTARVAVFASHAEEFGIAAVEAMACGTPVVAWREGGFVETLIDGSTGFLVESSRQFGEALRTVLSDTDRWPTLSHGAAERAREFSWERSVAGIERLCRQVFGTQVS